MADEVKNDPQGRAITNPVSRSLFRYWRKVGWTLIYTSPALFFFMLFSYVPFFRSLWLSLHITDGRGEPVRFVGWNYYARIVGLDGSGQSEYLDSILITFQFALLVVPLGILLSVGLGVLAAVRVAGIGFFRTIFTGSIAVSLASAGVIWAVIYDPSTRLTAWVSDFLNLPSPGVLANNLTALSAIALMTVWSGMGFNFIITLAGIQAIPDELYESGKIDGTNGWTEFRDITMPLLTPTLLFLLIIDTIRSFQAFTQFHILMNGAGPEGSTNVFVYATFRTFWVDNRYGFASAMSIVLFVILLVLTILQFRVLDRRVHYQ